MSISPKKILKIALSAKASHLQPIQCWLIVRTSAFLGDFFGFSTRDFNAMRNWELSGCWAAECRRKLTSGELSICMCIFIYNRVCIYV